MSVRTRFAPSPTGLLHLGNVRTAVFNWLFARHHDGAFVLRIEDTDVERNVEEAEEAIYDDLRWLGLDWDEGPDVGGPLGPYRQSEREIFYVHHAEWLLERDLAYRCYCTEEDLAGEREVVGEGEAVHRYSGRCRALDADESLRLEEEGRASSIRFIVPEEGEVEVKDEIRGAISFSVSDLSDFVILRSDGRPTYNFAAVVDDTQMEITHVIRGAGHLSNTPRQLLLYEALDEEPPRFVHLPTVLSPEGGKLSKREGGAAVTDLRVSGYHPSAVINYLSLLGWSAPDGREILEPRELVELISLDRVGASDTVYDPEKLRWMSAQHVARMDLDELTEAVRPFLERAAPPDLEPAGARQVVEALRTRLSTFAEIEDHLGLLFPEPGPEWEEARKSVRDDPAERAVVEAVRERLETVEPWEEETLDRSVRKAGKEIEAAGAALFHPVRKALIGSPSGPDLGKVLAALGREEVLSRLRATLDGGRGD